MYTNRGEKLFYLSVSNVTQDELQCLQMMLQIDLNKPVEAYPLAVAFANMFALTWSAIPNKSDREYIHQICQTVKGHLGRTIPIQIEIEEPDTEFTLKYICWRFRRHRLNQMELSVRSSKQFL